MRSLLAALLSFLTRLTLRRYRPQVIGVTGSVGKTSTVGAVAAVLGKRRRVRQSFGSYNNEIGLPLTVLGEPSPGRSLAGWAALIGRALWRIVRFDPAYPEVLVLEMGADRAGDLQYLTDLAPCTVGVLTAISPAHLEFFGSMADVVREKQTILVRLAPGGTAVLNVDDELVRPSPIPTGVRAVRYGLGESADVRGSDVALSYVSKGGQAIVRGTSFKVTYAGSTVPLLLPEAVGLPTVYAALAAVAVAVGTGLNLVEIAAALLDYRPPPGRLRLLPGVGGVVLLDDSYNASPRAALAAVDVLADLPVPAGAKRYAVLGDMAELGSYATAGHEEVGRRVAERGVGVLVTVGERARLAARAARLAGMDPQNIFSFAVAPEAASFLRDRLRRGDTVLVKGSQAMRMERVVRDLMAEPERAGEHLVRQGRIWQNR